MLMDPSKLNFKCFEQNPETAVLLWHLNRGVLQFALNGVETEEGRQLLINQVQNEVQTEEERKKMIEDYKAAVHNKVDLLSCGACGIRHFGHVTDPQGKKSEMKPNQFYRIDLNDLGMLLYSDEEVQQWKIRKEISVEVPDTDTTNKMIHPWKAKSVEENNLGVYHLHPEFVQHSEDKSEHHTLVCGTCMRAISAGRVPTNSIAAGVDYGDFNRIGLQPLTPMERLLIARARLYNRILKVTRSYGTEPWERQTLKGHHILFEHNAPTIVRHT